MRKFALILSVCAVPLLATFTHAQQYDIAVSGSTLFSFKNPTATLAYPPPPEKGGVYPGVSIDRIRGNHFGLNAEMSFRYKKGNYNNFQGYRPFIYDINALYTHHVAKKTSIEGMAGIGGQTVLFYNGFGNCGYASGCVNRVNSTQFLTHLGFAVNYDLWRKIFIRPEAHYYYIVNNTTNFHSGNIARLGASIGYTFHR